MYTTGDQVFYGPKNHKATVLRDLPNGEYIIEFEDKTLIPPQMKVHEIDLSPQELPLGLFGFMGFDESFPSEEKQSSINKDTHCPKCGKPWKETIIFGNKYLDCLGCNLKREDA